MTTRFNVCAEKERKGKERLKKQKEKECGEKENGRPLHFNDAAAYT